MDSEKVEKGINNFPTSRHCIFFNSHICHVCKTYDKPLKRCSACKAVFYCSNEHQKFDWKVHKKLCRLIKKSSCVDVVSNSFHDLLQTQYKKYRCMFKGLKRKLYEHEMQMWMFPRYCVICFSQESNIICQNCHNISYCSELHQEMHQSEHENYCDELKLSLEFDISLFNLDFGKISLAVIPRDLEDDINAFPKNLSDLMSIYDENYESDIDKMFLNFHKSDFIAPSATILYGLEISGFLKDRMYVKDDLVIHLVGADSTEASWLWKQMSELPFHWIKNLRNLEFILIGPELGEGAKADESNHKLCDRCIAKNCTTNVRFLEQVYHDVVNDLKKPDVVVAMNSGLNRYLDQADDTWRESIPFLCKYSNVPLILTAYNEDEMMADSHLVKQANDEVRILVDNHVNPFRNIKPLRSFTCNTKPVYYYNGYITVLLRD